MNSVPPAIRRSSRPRAKPKPKPGELPALSQPPQQQQHQQTIKDEEQGYEEDDYGAVGVIITATPTAASGTPTQLQPPPSPGAADRARLAEMSRNEKRILALQQELRALEEEEQIAVPNNGEGSFSNPYPEEVYAAAKNVPAVFLMDVYDIFCGKFRASRLFQLCTDSNVGGNDIETTVTITAAGKIVIRELASPKQYNYDFLFWVESFTNFVSIYASLHGAQHAETVAAMTGFLSFVVRKSQFYSATATIKYGLLMFERNLPDIHNADRWKCISDVLTIRYFEEEAMRQQIETETNTPGPSSRRRAKKRRRNASNRWKNAA